MRIINEKCCTKCKMVKPVGEFWKDKRTKNSLQSWCKSCRKQSLKDYIKKNPNYEAERYIREKDSIRERRLKRKYGITLKGYHILLASQKKCCAICGREEPKTKMLDVDHNHNTGDVRGLLCCNCNRMLGYAKDNIKILRDAIKYLESSHKSRSSSGKE